MQRPTHRRLIVLGLALLAVGALLLFGRQWISTPEPTNTAVNSTTRQLVEPKAEGAEPPPVAEPATPDTTTNTTAAASGNIFRGRVVDAVTRQPVKRFEVRLVKLSRYETRDGEPGFTQAFQSKDGRFAWQQAPVGNWTATVAAPRYQLFRIENLSIAAGESTRELVMPLRRGHTLKGRVFDQSSGDGIGDVYVTYRDPGASPRREDLQLAVHSKKDGMFVLDGVPDGEMTVTAIARAHAAREVVVVVKDDTPPLEIGLVTGGMVAGMVLASDGTPASGRVMLDGPGVPHGGELDAG
jgi:hypothetical protein